MNSFFVKPGSVTATLRVYSHFLPISVDVNLCGPSSCAGRDAISAKAHLLLRTPTTSALEPPSTLLTNPVATHDYEAVFPLVQPLRVVKICAYADAFPGQVPINIQCEPWPGMLTPVAGVLKIADEQSGVRVSGWLIDPSTDGSASVTIANQPSNGIAGARRTVELSASLRDSRSAANYPSFSLSHGFDAIVPFVGSAGLMQICVLARGATDPVACFNHAEMSRAWAPPSVAQGSSLQVSLRSIGPGTKVSVNLLSDAGYFVLPWTDPLLWKDEGSDGGSAGVTIDSGGLPPGGYRIAFRCLPDCAGETLGHDVTGGGIELPGTITLGPSLIVAANKGVAVDITSVDSTVTIHIAGLGPGSTVHVGIVPGSLHLYDGFPYGVERLLATADAQGTAIVERSVDGFIDSTHRTVQVLVQEDDSLQIIVSQLYTLP